MLLSNCLCIWSWKDPESFPQGTFFGKVSFELHDKLQDWIFAVAFEKISQLGLAEFTELQKDYWFGKLPAFLGATAALQSDMVSRCILEKWLKTLSSHLGL